MHRRLAACACLLLPTLVVAAEPPVEPWTVGGFAEIEKGGGYSFGGDFAYRTDGGTRWSFAAAHSELESDNLQPLATTRFDGGVRHSFGSVRVSLGAAWWQDPDTVTVREFNGGAEFGPPESKVGVRAAIRHSDFDPFPVTGVVILPNGRTVTASGTAKCTLDDTSYGLDLSRDTGPYVAYLSGRKYDYDPTDCSFTNRLLEAISRSSSRRLKNVAAVQTATLSRLAASQSDMQTSFLDYRIAAGFAWRLDDDEFGVDFDHVREQFDQIDANTLSVHWARALDRGVMLMLYGGAANSDRFGTLPFLGVNASRSF
jgi:hypothetical protein